MSRKPIIDSDGDEEEEPDALLEKKEEKRDRAPSITIKIAPDVPKKVIEEKIPSNKRLSGSGNLLDPKKQQLLLRSAIRLQRQFRIRKFKVSIEQQMLLNHKRKFVVREISHTEDEYVKRLKEIVTKFIQPLKEVLSQVELDNCFPGMTDIYYLHETFAEVSFSMSISSFHSLFLFRVCTRLWQKMT